MNIYFAAPLFTQAERMWNQDLTTLLRQNGHKVWLPQEYEVQSSDDHEAVFEKDLEGLNRAEVVLAVLDGPDPDSGTCWEVGYVFHKGTPVIGLRTDFRVGGGRQASGVNLMLDQSCKEVVQVRGNLLVTLHEVVGALERVEGFV